MVLGGLITGRLLVQEKRLLQLGAVVDHAGPPGVAGELDPHQAPAAVLHSNLDNISINENISIHDNISINENIWHFWSENSLPARRRSRYLHHRPCCTRQLPRPGNSNIFHIQSEIFSAQHTVFMLHTQYSGTREGSSISLTSLATEIISYL